MTHIDHMTDGELGLAVAKEVMGWTFSVDGCGEWRWCVDHHGHDNLLRNFCPATNISADYEVLKVARKWPAALQSSFTCRLMESWFARKAQAQDEFWIVISAVFYEPGDYARAALKAVRAEKEARADEVQ